MILGLFSRLIYSVSLGHPLNHLAIDNETGVIYVGAVNRIYQLDSDLRILVEVETGPRNDSPNCLPPPDPCSYPTHETQNYNKILVIDGNRKKLITCGSVYQGSCETRSLANVSKSRTYYVGSQVNDYAVAANEPNASTVAFIAPGPQGFEVLYVGTTYTGGTREDRTYRDDVPAVSSRKLDKNRFSFAEVSSPLQGLSSSIYLKRQVMSTYLIRYVSGFSSDQFSYFLTVQKDSVDESRATKNISKIIQICQNDPNFFSYADIPIRCAHGDVEYNMVQASAIIRPAERLRESFSGLSDADDVLVALFSRNTERGERKSDSAVCVYPMREVRAKFLENIKLCHQGNASVSGGGYLRVGPRGNCNQQVSAQRFLV